MSDSVDWSGWEACQDVNGRERHRPQHDHQGKAFIPGPGDIEPQPNVRVLDTEVVRADDFPPNVRVLLNHDPLFRVDAHGSVYASSRLRFVPLRPGIGR